MSTTRRAFDYRDAVMLILSALLLVAVIGAWRVATEKPPQVEMVQVLVAARDLTTGTAFTKDNVDELTLFADVPISVIPADAQLIKTKDELIGKRLSRATHQGEYFNAADVNVSRGCRLFEPGKDIMSIPLGKQASQNHIEPGSRVDIIASYIDGTESHRFILLPEMLVIAVNNVEVGRESSTTVSFSVDEKQVNLITLAQDLNCNFEFVLWHPDAPKREHDLDETLARLEELKKKREEPQLEIAPPPRVVGER